MSRKICFVSVSKDGNNASFRESIASLVESAAR